MNKTRKDGLSYAERHFGEISPECTAVSKFYTTEESWPKCPSWFHEFSLSKLKKCQTINLLCQDENSRDFHLLSVPVDFILENLKLLDVRKEDTVSLWLSARQEDRFCDLRGLGKINFSILQKNKKPE